mgnify:CR=1 FL=1
MNKLNIVIVLLFTKHNGSEFDVVIMPIMQAAPVLLTRTLLYTAMTRAKKMLILIGSPKTIEFMIQNADSKKRNTGLEFKMRCM